MGTYRLIDLFSGAGGMTLGFTSQPFDGVFESVWAVDHDRAAVETYSTNFGNHAVCGDIEEIVRHTKIPKADVVIGGPPCQGFSLLNKRRTGDVRRALWQPYMEVVKHSGASVFVIENVAELCKSPEADEIVARAEALGFECKRHVLNAADYGVPQTRKRTVIVGSKKGVPDTLFPPERTHKAPSLVDDSEREDWLTVRDAIRGLPEPVGTNVRKAKAPFDLHFGRSPRPISLKRYKAVPPGGNRFDLLQNAPDLTPGCWKRKKSGGTDLFGRLWWDRPSVTIRTEFFKPEKGRYLHPESHRPITHREAARLMGFPDTFKFAGTKIEIARQIGNAVPPPLAAAIAEMVTQLLAMRQARRKAA